MTRVELPATGGTDAVVELRARLLEALDRASGVGLLAAGMAEPSTALVQTIEAAAVDFAAAGLRFGLIDPSDALCAAYEDLGLFAALMGRILVDAAPEA